MVIKTTWKGGGVKVRDWRPESAQITATWFDLVWPTTVQSFGFGLIFTVHGGPSWAGQTGRADWDFGYEKWAPAGPHIGPVIRMCWAPVNGQVVGRKVSFHSHLELSQI